MLPTHLRDLLTGVQRLKDADATHNVDEFDRALLAVYTAHDNLTDELRDMLADTGTVPADGKRR